MGLQAHRAEIFNLFHSCNRISLGDCRQFFLIRICYNLDKHFSLSMYSVNMSPLSCTCTLNFTTFVQILLRLSLQARAPIFIREATYVQDS